VLPALDSGTAVVNNPARNSLQLQNKKVGEATLQRNTKGKEACRANQTYSRIIQHMFKLDSAIGQGSSETDNCQFMLESSRLRYGKPIGLAPICQSKAYGIYVIGLRGLLLSGQSITGSYC
jgi:hypothetical protein